MLAYERHRLDEVRGLHVVSTVQVAGRQGRAFVVVQFFSVVVEESSAYFQVSLRLREKSVRKQKERQVD